MATDGRPSVVFVESRPPIISHKSMPSLASMDDDDEDDRGKRKSSEWAFRPLKIKFKMKEFEKIYDRSVFRQQQQLLIYVCGLMVIIAMLILIIFLGKQKVGREAILSKLTFLSASFHLYLLTLIV